jgi:branched-chain amino acid aminotransferase
MKIIQWQQGRWVSAETIALTQEVLTGRGVFETILVEDQVPLFLEEHLTRLLNSCTISGLLFPDLDAIRVGVNKLVASHGLAPRARLRVTFFGGDDLVLSVVDIDAWPPSASVVLAPWTRNAHSAIAGAKSVSYAENVVALDWAQSLGFSEALFLDASGHLSEASTSNIVLVIDEVAVTPGLTTGCLPGITRSVLLELGLVIEAEIDVKDLEQASSAALLSSTRGVQPIRSVAVGGTEWIFDVSCDGLQFIGDSYLARVRLEKESWARLPKESRPT